MHIFEFMERCEELNVSPEEIREWRQKKEPEEEPHLTDIKPKDQIPLCQDEKTDVKK